MPSKKKLQGAKEKPAKAKVKAKAKTKVSKAAKARSTKAKTPKLAKAVNKRAGKPMQADSARAISRSRDATPSKADLDLRDRLKAGPRRAAGPHLSSDEITRSAMDALDNEVVTNPTDPS